MQGINVGYDFDGVIWLGMITFWQTNIACSTGNTSSKGPFSIAFLVFRSVEWRMNILKV